MLDGVATIKDMLLVPFTAIQIECSTMKYDHKRNLKIECGRESTSSILCFEINLDFKSVAQCLKKNTAIFGWQGILIITLLYLLFKYKLD